MKKTLVILCAPLFFATQAFGETQESNIPITTEQLCSSLLTPYEKKKDTQLRNRAYDSLVESQKLIEARQFENARDLLAEMLVAKGWGKKLSITETQYVYQATAVSYVLEKLPDEVLAWYSKIYLLEGQAQPCDGSSLCLAQIPNTGSYLKRQLRYDDASEWLKTLDQCPSVFDDKSKIKMTKNLFEIAVATDDEQGAMKRGNWLLERANKSSDIDAELQHEIRTVLDAYQAVVL